MKSVSLMIIDRLNSGSFDSKQKRILWRSVDNIYRSEQTWWLLVAKHSSIWSQLPREIVCLVQQYISTRDSPYYISKKTWFGHNDLSWVFGTTEL